MSTKLMKYLIGIIIALILIVNVVYQYNKVTTIKFYAHPDKDGKMSEYIQQFENENPRIKVDLIDLPDNTSKKYEIISTALALKDGSIDVIDADITWPTIFVSYDWVEPLDGYFTKAELDDYLDSTIESNTINGNLYGIPYRIDAGLLYYRKDLLDAYNHEVPTTWNQLEKIVLDIKEKESIDGFAGSWYSYEGLSCNIMEFLWAYNGGVDITNQQLSLDTKENRAALLKMHNMVNDSKVVNPEVLNYKSGDVRRAFAEGKLIFSRDWPAGWKGIERLNPDMIANDMVGVTRLPSSSDDIQSYGTLGGWQYMVSKHSNHKTEAVKLIKFLTSYEIEKSNTITYSYLPSREALYRDEDVINNLPFLEGNAESINATRSRPKLPNYDYLSLVLQDEVKNYLEGNVNLEEALESIDIRLNQ